MSRSDRWLPLPVAARVLGVPARTLRRHCERGLLADDARRAPSLTRPGSPRSRAGATHWQVRGAFVDRFVEALGAEE